jgi:hypothetical protein
MTILRVAGAEVSPVSGFGSFPRAARHCSVSFPALLVMPVRGCRPPPEFLRSGINRLYNMGLLSGFISTV